MNNTPEPTQPKRRGCFFYGCMTVLVLALIAGIAAFFAVRYGLKKANSLIGEYTDTQAVALPTNELSTAQSTSLEKRWTTFQDALSAHSNVPPISLTGPELNALLTGAANKNHTQAGTASGSFNAAEHFHIGIESNQVKGEV